MVRMIEGKGWMEDVEWKHKWEQERWIIMWDATRGYVTVNEEEKVKEEEINF